MATLAIGLRNDSRVKGEYAGIEQPPVGITLLNVLDAINGFAYAVLGGREAPARAINAYLIGEKTKHGYSTGAEFERARKAIIDKHGK